MMFVPAPFDFAQDERAFESGIAIAQRQAEPAELSTGAPDPFFVRIINAVRRAD